MADGRHLTLAEAAERLTIAGEGHRVLKVRPTPLVEIAMSYPTQNPYQNPYQAPAFGAVPAILAEEDARSAFIRQTYLHLFGAILLFVAFEAAVFTLVPVTTMDGLMGQLFASRYGYLVVLLGFMGISWLANAWANSEASQAMQYAGLLLYVFAEGVIFVPL